MSRLKNTSLDYDGLWFPKAVHPRTVTIEDLLSENPRAANVGSLRRCSATRFVSLRRILSGMRRV